MYLFSGDFHVIGDVSEDCRLDKISVLTPSVTSTSKRGSILTSGSNVFQNSFKLSSIHLCDSFTSLFVIVFSFDSVSEPIDSDLRTLISLRIKGISQSTFESQFNRLRDKVVVDRVMDKSPRCSAANLPGIVKNGFVAKFDYFINCKRKKNRWGYISFLTRMVFLVFFKIFMILGD